MTSNRALLDTSAIVKKYQSPSFAKRIAKEEKKYDIVPCEMVNVELSGLISTNGSLGR